MRIDTKLGKGTTVSVYLPRAHGIPARQTLDRSSPNSAQSRAATILVADDDRDVRELTVACLESLGYRVLAADGGRAALDVIESAASVTELAEKVKEALDARDAPRDTGNVFSIRPGARG